MQADPLKTGALPITKVHKIFKELKLPKMNAKLKEFFEYLVFRQSDSLATVNYELFLEILEENYLIEESPYEDPQDLNPGMSHASSLKQSSDVESPT